MNNQKNHTGIKLSVAGLLVTMGIVYGDIGTSPLYVMKAIISGHGIDENFILGAISCIFWTLTFQTTVKYVIITLRADNKGEGGIMSLYALLRKRRKWAFIIAMIGGSALLADGVITPSLTVVSAIEGLKLKYEAIPVIPISIGIIFLLFFFQQYGTNVLGKFFGPIMFIWFSMLGILGMAQVFHNPAVLKAFNPWYAYNLLVNVPQGFFILGAVFLCTTGAEALYSDLGHCGVRNIRVSWIFVKLMLVINYLGQGAWVINHASTITSDTNPFYTIMPAWFLLPGVILATAAAIIASQALISGSFTLISEAIPLNFWPKVRIKFPSTIKGQMYIPQINWFLAAACIFVVIFFQESTKMEAAYGLSITITMLMTTILMTIFIQMLHYPVWWTALFATVYILIESSFLAANMSKFVHGGWVTLMLAAVAFIIMYVWYKGREIKKSYSSFVKIVNYAPILRDMKEDTNIPKFATNLIYLTRADRSVDIESKIMYSIITNQPKRADMYWFVHVHIVEDPHVLEYSVEYLVPDVLNRIEFKIGFKNYPKINLYFRSVIENLVRNREIDVMSRYPSLRKHKVQGDFRFIVIDRVVTQDCDFKMWDNNIMNLYDIVRNIGISDIRGFGLDASNAMVEKVPLVIKDVKDINLVRIFPEKRKDYIQV